MSKIETNTIAPSTGTTLTLGESGDTVQVGTGEFFFCWYDKDSGDYESEDTMSILNKYIDEAEINLDKIPLIGNPIKAITWGDDYQLCFTISSSKSEKLAELSKKHKVKITNIGKLTKGK